MSRRPPLSREPVEVTIDGFTHGGEGVARIEGKAVFVPDTIPGERVVVRVVDDRRTWARAALVAVVEASPHRVEPPCPYADPRRDLRCGGCDLQHVRPDHQRALKTRVVREQLARLGGVEDAPVSPTRPVGPDSGYRTSARLHAAADGRLGFHASGSHDVVAIDRCLVLGDRAQAVREQLGDGSGAAEARVRGHDRTGAAAVVLTPGPGGLEVPAGDTDVVLAQPDGSTVPLRGDGVLTETIAGVTYRFPADGFFQVNAAGADALVAAVLGAAGEVAGALVWDLYAGVGLFAVPLAAAGAEVVAVEDQRSSARCARLNADAHGADIDVVEADVRGFLERAVEGADLPDVVVLDPPRSGAGRRVVERVAACGPATIVYVACDVAALARDTRALVETGYELVSAQPFDLFPHTHHVEVVAAFRA